MWKVRIKIAWCHLVSDILFFHLIIQLFKAVVSGWTALSIFCLLGAIILELELRDVSGFLLCLVFVLFCFYVLSCFVRRQCWASCPTELTMGVSRHL